MKGSHSRAEWPRDRGSHRVKQGRNEERFGWMFVKPTTNKASYENKQRKLCHRKDCQPLPWGGGGLVSVRGGGNKIGQGWHNGDIDGDNQDFKNYKHVGNCGDV